MGASFYFFTPLFSQIIAQNNWAQDITLAELKKIWEPSAQGKITTWNQIRPTWPNKPLNLYGLETDNLQKPNPPSLRGNGGFKASPRIGERFTRWVNLYLETF